MASKIFAIIFIIAIATSAMAITPPQKLLLLFGAPSWPSGTVYLTDSDGAYITDSDGAYITF